MKTQQLHIKNMVCPRCIKVVREELINLGLTPVSVNLGVAEVSSENSLPIEDIKAMLELNGFELLQDKNSTLVEKIKGSIIDLIYNDKLLTMKENMSHYLSQLLAKDYSSLSNLFSSTEGITIEKYFILQKIERVKELLVYDELTLSEIAYRLGYSSVQALSNQFKKVTGLNPSYFKSIGMQRRNSIDDLKNQ